MSDNTYTGTASALETKLGSIIAPAVLANILKTVTPDANGDYSIGLTNGSTSFDFDASMFSAAIINGSVTNISDLEKAVPNSSGGYDDLGSLATDITNTGTTPITFVASGSAFAELQGTATLSGGDAPLFVVDGSHDTSAISLNAGSGTSFLIGGTGPDTLTGSTSSTGAAVLVAGSGPTTMTGGLGADSLYGGGNTTMTGGSGMHQILEDFTLNAHDSISAGTGGGQILAVASGSSTLNDTNGSNDSLYAGTGSDTLIGSASGTHDYLFGGSTTIVDGGSDTITASTTTGLSNVSFAGAASGTDFSALVLAAQKAADPASPSSVESVTISFGTSGGTTETATLNNVSHIHFS